MRELYTPELMQLVKELKAIEGFYIDQFYELDKNRFRFKLSKKGEKSNLQCILPYTLNRTEFVELKEEASGFSLAVRKRLSGARIESIYQLGEDRILAIRFSKANAESYIIFEMFGKGNMIIADPDMKIQLVYVVHNFKDRSVKTGEIYNPPKNIADNPDREPEKERVIGYLNKRFGMGTMYADEAARRVKIAPEVKLGELSRAEQGYDFNQCRNCQQGMQRESEVHSL